MFKTEHFHKAYVYMFDKRQKKSLCQSYTTNLQAKKIDDDDDQGDSSVGVGGDADNETDGNYRSHYALT